MKRLSFIAATGLSLALSPLAVSAASADASGASPRLPAHKVPAFLHRDDEPHCRDTSLAAQASAGAFLEMTAAAP